jgi:hypothetical protein
MRSIYWVASDCTSRRQVAIQASDRCLVAFRLYVPVGVGRLADGRVPHLLLHPSEISAIREQPGCKGVARCVVLPVGQTGLPQTQVTSVTSSIGPIYW